MQLKDLLKECEYACIKGNEEVEITDIVFDSRKVVEGSVFVCIRGTAADSHDFISEAYAKGAVAIVIEKEVKTTEPVTFILVASTRKAMAYMSAAYFGHPAKELMMIGITGTKGKTTTSYMIKKMLEISGKKTAVIGTIGTVIDGTQIQTSLTTPESYELQSILRKIVDAGCEYCVMEVSSQGLKLERTAGILFDYGVFTNFSSDHIGPGEHADMEEYLRCKSLLFQQCKTGIINVDDEAHEGILNGHTCSVKTYGFHEKADLRAENLEYIADEEFFGVAFELTGLMQAHVKTGIPGTFSVYNSLAALLVCIHLGLSKDKMLLALMQAKVRGRMELVPVQGPYHVMIDYAHNALSVESLMVTIQDYKPKRIICIYGCGGNRSRLRRYDMGELCGKYADLSILTCDNPRDEEIDAINEDIKVGLAKSGGHYIEIPDRKEAIVYSLNQAEPGDIIMLIGKGHEDYQEIKGKKYYFNEREVIEEYLNSKQAN